MALTVIRVSAVLLVVTLGSAVGADSQGVSKADAHDFQMFRHTIAVQRNARVCERTVPEYRQSFEELYSSWSEKHRAEIARGEALFKRARTVNDAKRDPYIDPVIVAKIEQGLAELAAPAKAAAPTAPAARTAVACDRLLTFLKQN